MGFEGETEGYPKQGWLLSRYKALALVYSPDSHRKT